MLVHPIETPHVPSGSRTWFVVVVAHEKAPPANAILAAKLQIELGLR
jgi:hypothetical protein